MEADKMISSRIHRGFAKKIASNSIHRSVASERQIISRESMLIKIKCLKFAKTNRSPHLKERLGLT